MIEVKVQSLGLDRKSNTPVVVLKEDEGDRVLPIWIGPSEASAIAMEMAGMKFSRPLTHDLFASVIRGLGGSLQRVNITKVVDNTYYAELVIQRGADLITVDARPSDSIAIALRLDATIHTSDEMLDSTDVEIAEAPESMAPGDVGGAEDDDDDGDDSNASSAGLSSDELKEHLRRMHPEDFGRFSP